MARLRDTEDENRASLLTRCPRTVGLLVTRWDRQRPLDVIIYFSLDARDRGQLCYGFLLTICQSIPKKVNNLCNKQ